MQSSRARVYGDLLFGAALASKNEENFLLILKELSHLFHTDPLFARFFHSPLIGLSEKLEFLKSEPVLQNFMEILILNNEVSLLPKIFSVYEECFDKSTGREDLVVVSAEPLPLKRQKEITKTLSEKMDIHFEVDPSLLSGYRVYWDSKLLPLSSKDFLHSIKEMIAFETLSSE